MLEDSSRFSTTCYQSQWWRHWYSCPSVRHDVYYFQTKLWSFIVILDGIFFYENVLSFIWAVSLQYIFELKTNLTAAVIRRGHIHCQVLICSVCTECWLEVEGKCTLPYGNNDTERRGENNRGNQILWWVLSLVIEVDLNSKTQIHMTLVHASAC